MSTLVRVASGVVFVPFLIVVSRAGGGWFLALTNMILLVGLWVQKFLRRIWAMRIERGAAIDGEGKLQ